MESTNFFPGTSRLVTLSSVTLQKDRRIKCTGVRMILSGESVQSMPDWLGDAYTAVSKSFTEVQPPIQQISGLAITFANHAPGEKPPSELFEGPAVKAVGAELRTLSVLRTGDGEDPDVTLQFNLYAPFSRPLWKWLGEMAGADVHMAFPSGKQPIEVVSPQQAFIAERPELDPKHDTEFATPTVEETLGPKYEEDVRKSLGATPAKPRMVSVKTPPEKKRGRNALAGN